MTEPQRHQCCPTCAPQRNVLHNISWFPCSVPRISSSWHNGTSPVRTFDDHSSLSCLHCVAWILEGASREKYLPPKLTRNYQNPPIWWQDSVHCTTKLRLFYKSNVNRRAHVPTSSSGVYILAMLSFIGRTESCFEACCIRLVAYWQKRSLSFLFVYLTVGLNTKVPAIDPSSRNN